MNTSLNNKNLSLTVGITTCYGDPSILDTVKSLRPSVGVLHFRFIIVADRKPFADWVKEELRKYDVELIENKVEAGQCPKKKQIIAMTDSDILIFTQDDVLFDRNTISAILKRFEEHQNTKLISIRKQPVAALNLFEDITKVGTRVINRVARSWNDGDNYLATVGRCMAVRTEWARKFTVPDNVVSSDAYFYFENKRLGGGFEYLPEVAVLYRKPQSLIEHYRKSSRFQYQRQEMTKYFGNVKSYYKIPRLLFFHAIISEWLSQPLRTTMYFGIYAYTRLFKQNAQKALNAIWEVDLSTKKI